MRNLTNKDFINGVYEDQYVRFYLGHHTIVKLPQSSFKLVMSFGDENKDMNVVSKYYNEHLIKINQIKNVY